MLKRRSSTLLAFFFSAILAVSGQAAFARCAAMGQIFETGEKLCSQGQLAVCSVSGNWVNIGRC